MRTVYLHGALGKKYGKAHEFEIDSIQEAIQALRANFPTFIHDIRDGLYRVIVGKKVDDGLELDMSQIFGFKLGNQDLHILPVPEGARSGGLGKLIMGIALIGLSAMTGGAAGALMGQTLWGTTTVGSLTGSIGVSMLLTGVASMIAPEASSSTDENKSFTMTGPANTTKEGSIVPVVYGEVYTGGVMISGGLNISTKGQDQSSTSGTNINIIGWKE